jgi:aminoglycoside phosphotransferase (APT) family kinase protein
VCDSARVTGALEQRAVAAAGTVAAACGLAFEEAVVIHSASNVLVRLAPAPVVARVMSGTAALHDDPQRWLEREVSVLEFLAPTGMAVAPSRLIAPGPYGHDGLWLTFTEWVPGVEPAGVDDARRAGHALRELHGALARFDGDLAGTRELGQDIARLLGELRPADADEAAAIARWREQLDRLGPVVFDTRLPGQALHGDVSVGNLLRTPPDRLLWNDFEDTFRGPVEWDVASCVGSLRVRGADPSAVRAMLDAYGWQDERALDPFLAVQDVYVEIWQAYDRQRRRA